MSSQIASCGKPPISFTRSRRTRNEVPTQKAQPEASLAGWNTSKKMRWSSTQASAAIRLCWIGSALKKNCGVCTTAQASSWNSPTARLRMFGITAKSASSTRIIGALLRASVNPARC